MRDPQRYVLAIALAVVGFAGLTASTAGGTPVGVSVNPETPSTADPVIVLTELWWNTGGYSVIDQEVVFSSAFSVDIEIFVSSPEPGSNVIQSFTGTTASTPLGNLPAGTYDYTIRETQIPGGTTPGPGFSAGQFAGHFVVVPEPTSTLMLGLGLVGLAGGRRRLDLG